MDVSAAPGVGPAHARDVAAPPPCTGTDAGRADGRRENARRIAEEAATRAPAPPHAAPPRDTPRTGLNPAEIPLEVFDPEDAAAPGERGSGHLKFDIATADVLARFAIDEETNRVTVTMFQRDTGEIIREVPPRPVMDVVEVLQGRGLVVDVSM